MIDNSKIWWISQPEAHSFYLKQEEYNAIQVWIANHIDEEAMVYGVEILGSPHPSHAICRLYSHDTNNTLGDLSHPIFETFTYLKDIRQELKEFTYGNI